MGPLPLSPLFWGPPGAALPCPPLWGEEEEEEEEGRKKEERKRKREERKERGIREGGEREKE